MPTATDSPTGRAHCENLSGELFDIGAVTSLISSSREKGAMMFVDPELLHSGAKESHRAGGQARDGADQLGQGSLGWGMFGDFAAAEAFYEAVSSAHAWHVKTLQAHQEVLTTVGTKAHYVAREFTAMDGRNAAEMRSVRGTSGT